MRKTDEQHRQPDRGSPETLGNGSMSVWECFLLVLVLDASKVSGER